MNEYMKKNQGLGKADFWAKKVTKGSSILHSLEGVSTLRSYDSP
jgi:hypothetical protein